jgi:hypothetical protein
MHPSTTGRCGVNGLPIGPFTGGNSGSIRAHCASVNIAVVDIYRQSTLRAASSVRHALVPGRGSCSETARRKPSARILSAVRGVSVVLLVGLLSGCASQQAGGPGAEPRRYTDYTTRATADPQCSLPVEQRTGGWFCYEPQPTPAP